MFTNLITNRFTSSQEVKNCEDLKITEHTCEKFWKVVQDDLNGSFHCEYTVDDEGELIGHGRSLSLRSIACCYSNV